MLTYLLVLIGLNGALAAGVGAPHLELTLNCLLLHRTVWWSGLKGGGELVKV